MKKVIKKTQEELAIIKKQINIGSPKYLNTNIEK